MVTRSVSSKLVVMMTSCGTPFRLMGMAYSYSSVSLSVDSSQNTPLTTRKNKKMRNSLFTMLNRKSLSGR